MAHRHDDFELDEDEDKKSGKALGARRKFDDFDCPTCSANNPCDSFGNGDELLCNWCGVSFRAVVDGEGALRLKEL